VSPPDLATGPQEVARSNPDLVKFWLAVRMASSSWLRLCRVSTSSSRASWSSRSVTSVTSATRTAPGFGSAGSGSPTSALGRGVEGTQAACDSGNRRALSLLALKSGPLGAHRNLRAICKITQPDRVFPHLQASPAPWSVLRTRTALLEGLPWFASGWSLCPLVTRHPLHPSATFKKPEPHLRVLLCP
jgi:hypothetical protein